MNKSVMFAKKVDRIELEMKEEWPLEKCKEVASKIACDHGVPVHFHFQDNQEVVLPDIIAESQPHLPGI